MGMLASDVRRDGSLTAAWDGATPATEPLNTCVTVNQPANGCVTFQLTGTWVGTLTFEVSLDGTYVAVPATKLGASPAQATTTTTTGIYVVHAPGTVYIRARCSAFTSGTITVIGIGTVTEFIPSAAGLSSAGASTVAGSLTNNNAAPSTNHLAALTTVANAAAPSWSEGNEVLLSTNLAGALRVILPGTSVVSGTGTFTVAGGLTNNNAAPGATNVGVLPVLANAAAPTITEGRQSLLSTDLAGALRVILPGTSVVSGSGTFTVAGAKTNNNAAPGATNAGVLPALANAAAPSWTEGNQVATSVDLTGFQRGIIHGTTAGGASATGINPVLTGFVGTGATIRNWTASNSVTATAGNDVPGVGPLVYDSSGALWNRQRDTNSADNSSGTGLAGAGLLGWDGSVYRRASTDTSGRQAVVGAAATGAAVAGNPVLMAGSDGTNAQAVMIGTGASARVQMVGIASGVGGSGDGLGVAGFSSMYGLTALTNGLCNMPHLYNGTTADRMRANEDRILLASALRSSTSGPTALVTYNHRAIYFVLDTTVHTGSGIVKLVVDFIDPASGKAINLLTGANVIAATTNVYKIGIGLTAAANLVAVEYLARNLQWTVTLVSGTSVTYSLGCCLMPA